MDKNIALIDDDQKLNSLLQAYLSKFGYSVAAFTHPKDGLYHLEKHPPNLIILDVMLPDMDGFEVCRQIRRRCQTPIIMLTARGEVTDRIVGLEIGADDYIPKPFEPRELVARIQSVLRRGHNPEPHKILSFGSLRIDLQKHALWLNNKAVDLTGGEFKILKLLVSHPGRVLSRDEIVDQLRGLEWDVFDRSADVLISRLRRKLQDDPKHPRFIKTVWGGGYLFMGDRDE